MGNKHRMNTKPQATKNWAAYRDNFPRHVIALSRHLQSEIMNNLIVTKGHKSLLLSFEPYIALIGNDGCRLTEIAEYLSITKQSCNKTVNQLEKLGYIKRAPDPADKRAKILRLTTKGYKLIDDGVSAAIISERNLEKASSKAKIHKLSKLLLKLHTSLGLKTPRLSSADRQEGNLTVTLPRISNYIMQRVMDITAAKGHSGLKMSYNSVLSLIGPEGGKLQQMAEINNVSKQAISSTISELIDKNYLERSFDPTHTRQVTFRLTTLGNKLIDDSTDSIHELEKELKQRLSKLELEQLKSIVKDIFNALQLERSVFESNKKISNVARQLKSQLKAEEITLLINLLAKK